MRTIEEIITAIKANRERNFYHEMKDRWSTEDFITSHRLNAEYTALLKEYREVAGEDYKG